MARRLAGHSCAPGSSLRVQAPIRPARASIMRACSPRAGLLSTLQHQVATRQRSAVEVTQSYLDALMSVENQVNSFISVDAEAALAQAAAVDAALARGQPAGPLAGVPLAIKDNICTAGLATTAGSAALRGYVPPHDATVVARLRTAGAVLLGKTNMDEFGMGSSTEASAFKPTHNPWDLSRVPGGSSGGSAAAVAARQAVASLGSDTGGSIRQPAHFCGVVGVKPSYGRVSRYGLVAYASSLDTIGPLAHSVADAAALLQVVAGHDAADATCSAEPVPQFLAGLQAPEQLPDAPLRGLRVGVVAQTMGEGVAPGVAAAVDGALKHLQALGADVQEVSLPSFELGLPAYYVLALSEASSNLARYDGVRYGPRPDAPPEDLGELYRQVRGSGLGAEVKRRILMGTYALSAGYYDAYYKRAQQVRTLVQRELDSALQLHDVLLCPAAPTVAYRLGEKLSDPLAMYKGDLMTVNLNLAGLPAVVLPCGFADAEGTQLPVGVQLIGRMFGEAELLRTAHVYEVTARVMDGTMPAVAAQPVNGAAQEPTLVTAA